MFFADGETFRVGGEGDSSPQYRQVWVDKDPKKKGVSPSDIVQGTAQGGLGAMAAPGVSYQGVGTLSFVEKGVELNKDVYRERVKKVYYPDKVMPSGGKAACLQEGASSHAAKTVKEYLKSCSSNTLEPRPASSPDFTPIDYGVWGILALALKPQQPKAGLKLKVAIRIAVATLRWRLCGIPLTISPKVCRRALAPPGNSLSVRFGKCGKMRKD